MNIPYGILFKICNEYLYYNDYIHYKLTCKLLYNIENILTNNNNIEKYHFKDNNKIYNKKIGELIKRKMK